MGVGGIAGWPASGDSAFMYAGSQLGSLGHAFRMELTSRACKKGEESICFARSCSCMCCHGLCPKMQEPLSSWGLSAHAH